MKKTSITQPFIKSSNVNLTHNLFTLIVNLLVLVFDAAKFSIERTVENGGGGGGVGGVDFFSRGESEAELELFELEEGRQEEMPPSLVEFQRRRQETTNQEEAPMAKSSSLAVWCATLSSSHMLFNQLTDFGLGYLDLECSTLFPRCPNPRV